jgi:UDP-4-amino-4,6-dideoxy-N-acetyl-beta-L-altrosamine transaminase
MDKFLPYGRQYIDDEDIEAVVDVLRSDFLTGGPAVDLFEQAIAEKLGVEEAIVCSNGTTALHLAVIAAGITAGDIVVVPSVTFLSTANVVRMCGADVIFADVDPDTGLLTTEALLAAIECSKKKPKAVMPVHLNGQSCNMKEISNVARQHEMIVITDCCHALGAEYSDFGKPGDGRYEAFGCFSLHPVKSIAMGEGGIVTTNNTEAAKRIRRLRSHDLCRDENKWQNTQMGFEGDDAPNPWYYEMHELGFNYRATDMQCALGLSQLKKLDAFVGRRRELAVRYDKAFKSFSNSVYPVRQNGFSVSAWHLYPLLIDFKGLEKTRAQVMNELRFYNVGSQVHYIPVHKQPYYEKLYGVQELPGADTYYAKILSIPLYPALTNNEQDYIVERLKNCLQ